MNLAVHDFRLNSKRTAALQQAALPCKRCTCSAPAPPLLSGGATVRVMSPSATAVMLVMPGGPGRLRGRENALQASGKCDLVVHSALHLHYTWSESQQLCGAELCCLESRRVTSSALHLGPPGGIGGCGGGGGGGLGVGTGGKGERGNGEGEGEGDREGNGEGSEGLGGGGDGGLQKRERHRAGGELAT